MNFRYEDHLPTLPDNIVAEMYRLIENPIDNRHMSEEVFNYMANNISSDPGLQLNAVDDIMLEKLKGAYSHKEDSLGFPMNTASEYFQNLATFDFLPVSDMITEWVNKNISPTPVLISIQVMQGGSRIIPHIDEARNYVYNYVIETADATTNFYKNARDYEHLTAYPQTIFTYDRIEVTSSILIEPNRWHYIAVNKIHSVENIKPGQKRISLSLSYD
jgi:hypothetical protein